MQRSPDLPDYAWNESGAQRYAREAEKMDIQYRVFLERLSAVPPPARILDVGAGPGTLTVKIAALFPYASITALEVSPVMVKLGCDYIEKHGLQKRINYVQADAGVAEAMRDIGQYDLICSCYSLHEWKNVRATAIQLQSKLVDDGIMLLHDLRRVPWLAWLPLNFPMLQSIRASYTVSELRALLSGLPDSEVTVQSETPWMLTAKIHAVRL